MPLPMPLTGNQKARSKRTHSSNLQGPNSRGERTQEGPKHHLLWWHLPGMAAQEMRRSFPCSFRSQNFLQRCILLSLMPPIKTRANGGRIAERAHYDKERGSSQFNWTNLSETNDLVKLYSSAVSGTVQSKPPLNKFGANGPKPLPESSDINRKYNLIVFGISESQQGTPLLARAPEWSQSH